MSTLEWKGMPGFDGVQYRNETYALSLTTRTWTRLHPLGGTPPAREGTSLVYDPANDQFVLFGGSNESGYLQRGSLGPAQGRVRAKPRRRPSGLATRSELSLSVRSPTRNGRLSLRLSFATSQDATLDVLDVGGRRIHSHRITNVRAGSRDLELDLGARVSPGVYFVRVAQNGTARSARVVMIR